jgi:hypothetical protein
VFGDRGIKRAMGIISFLALFFKSSNISIPSFYLAIDTSSLDISLIFFGKISGFRHLSLQLRDLYEFEGRFSDRIVAGME